jgi:uncharacterized protein YxjI
MGLLDTDVIVMDQVRSFLSNDFAIHDAQGQVVGSLRTEGGVGARMLMGNRDLAVHDTDGSLAFRVTDPPDLGFDTFEVHEAAGGQVARIVKEFTFFSKSLRVELWTGGVMSLKGELFDREFTVMGPLGEAARVSRRWPGVAEFLLSRERYAVAMAPGLALPERMGTIGAVVALDLIRAKERAGSS